MRRRLPSLFVPAAVAVLALVHPARPPALEAQDHGADAGVRGTPEAGTAGPSEVYNGAEGELRVKTPVVEAPEISMDARLDEPAWRRAAVLTGFTQFEPLEGEPASQETDVRIFITDEAIYFGVRARDEDPGGIRATLGERDEIQESDDYIRVSLDTFDDNRRAWVFLVNPLGVQQDGIWVEGGGGRRRGFGPPIDWNQDFLWSSAGRIDDRGFVAEIRIPFKSLRFPDADVQSWGLQVVRAIKRTGIQEAWAPITEDEANQLAQQGRLADLRGLDPGLFLEFNPVVTGRRTGAVEENDAGEDVFSREDPTAEFGFNTTYGLTSNLTLDGTFNPDFSQVEADAGQIAVNERFALFFPEKRPFFLEGTEIFSLPTRLVFTRTITDPIAGAKVTGKLGAFNVGYLGAVDEGGRKLGGTGNAVVNLFRARKDIGESSMLGLTYTDRTVGADAYNRVAGLDARLVFGGRYTFSFQGAGSVTARGAGDDDVDPENAFAGSLLRAELERSGRTLSFNASLVDLAPEFRARSGFIRRIGDAQLRSRLEYNRYGDRDDLIERWGPRMEFNRVWDHRSLWRGEAPQEGELQLGGSVSLRNNITFFATYSRSFFEHRTRAYADLFRREPGGAMAPFFPDQSLFDGLDGLRLFLWSNTFDAVRGRIRAEWKETPIFDRATRLPVEPADAYTVDGSFTVLPGRHLRAEIGLRHEELYRKRDGSRHSIATIPRLEAKYQFSRALFLRFIGEYSREEREALRDPATGDPLLFCDAPDDCDARDGSVDNDIHVEALLSYEPSPGTVFFVGYSRDMEEEDAFSFDELDPTADGLFAKVSYRFRF